MRQDASKNKMARYMKVGHLCARVAAGDQILSSFKVRKVGSHEHVEQMYLFTFGRIICVGRGFLDCSCHDSVVSAMH